MIQYNFLSYLVSSVLFYTIAAHLLSSKILPEHTAVFAVSIGASISWVVHLALFGKPKENENKQNEATTAHFVCSGLLLGFSRFFEFASLARNHPITHEATWALIPVFYIVAAESWKALKFEYSRTTWTLSALFVGVVALIFTAVGNEVRSKFGLIYAISWIATKAYYVIYTHYIRIALGADPAMIHLWSNLVAAVFAAVFGIVDCYEMALSGSTITWFLVLVLSSVLYGIFYHRYDCADLRANVAQTASYRCQTRMVVFGIVGSIFWPVITEYNYVAFFVSWFASMIYKYLHKWWPQDKKEEEAEDEEEVLSLEKEDNYTDV